MIDPKIFKAYDIRGVYPTQINPEVIIKVIKGLYTYFSQKTGLKNLNIAIGHDMRISSPELHKNAVKTAVECGAIVHDLGLIATPTMYYAVQKFKLDIGIQLTASHNPKEYNGVKIALRDGDRIIKIGNKTGLADISEIVRSQKFLKNNTGGKITKRYDLIKEEVDTAFKRVNIKDVKNKTIISDPANAMGIIPLKEIFSKMNTRHIMINDFLDGTFPAHQADPLQHKTLRQLQDKVIEEKADLGICTDGDADRAMFIDEQGEIIPATLITTLIAGEVLRDYPGARILVDIRYIKNVEKMVSSMGGDVGYTPVGHALITQQVNSEKALFAGESSGHYYFYETGGCESTVTVILYVLRVLERENKPISEILKNMQSSYESGESNFKLVNGVKTSDVVNKICETYKDGQLNTLDGIAISYDNWRFSVRSSNTEPLLRLNVEGISKNIVDSNLNNLEKQIIALGAHKEE